MAHLSVSLELLEGARNRGREADGTAQVGGRLFSGADGHRDVLPCGLDVSSSSDSWGRASCSGRRRCQWTVIAVGQYSTLKWHISASSSRSW